MSDYRKSYFKSGFSVALFATLIGIVGCTANHTAKIWNKTLKSVYLVDDHQVFRANNWRLDDKYSVYLGSVEFVGLDKTLMPRTSNLFDQEVKLNFKKYFSAVYYDDAEKSLSRELRHASKLESRLLIKTRILDFVDNLNRKREVLEGSGIHEDNEIARDKTLLQFRIYDVNSKALLDTTTVMSKQRLFAKNESSTADLFADAIEIYLRAITGSYSNS